MRNDAYNTISNCLFNGNDNWQYQETSYFCDVTWNDLLPLMTQKIISEDSRSKYYAPTFSEIMEFLSNHVSEFTCHGVVNTTGNKIEIKIEGLYSANFIEKDREDFLKFAATSDILRSIENPFILYNRW